MPNEDKIVEARGRNGWFKPKEANVSRFGDRLSIGISSKRQGANDPIYITGTVNEVASMFRQINDEVSRFAACESGFQSIPIVFKE